MTTWFNSLNLRPQERRLVIGVLIGAFILLNVWFVWPHFGDWARNTKRAEETELKVRRYQNEVENISRYRSLIQELEQGGGATIAAAEQAVQFQKTIQEIANRSGVAINRYDPANPRRGALGGSGSAMRTLSCCVGPSRCEHACVDTMDIIYDLTMHFQMEIHRPAWPYKFKIKVSGCPNDCAAASARSDLAVIGVWRDTLEIDQQAVARYVDEGFDLFDNVLRRCPTWALDWNAEQKQLEINAEDCVHCMHCINEMPRALHVGKERGAAVLIGGKAPVVKGAMIGWVLIPFMKLQPPYQELKDLVVAITEFWAEHGKSRERLAELIDRLGMAAFLEAIGVKPCPQMVNAPRSNPYLFWREEEVNRA